MSTIYLLLINSLNRADYLLIDNNRNNKQRCDVRIHSGNDEHYSNAGHNKNGRTRDDGNNRIHLTTRALVVDRRLSVREIVERFDGLLFRQIVRVLRFFRAEHVLQFGKRAAKNVRHLLLHFFTVRRLVDGDLRPVVRVRRRLLERVHQLVHFLLGHVQPLLTDHLFDTLFDTATDVLLSGGRRRLRHLRLLRLLWRRCALLERVHKFVHLLLRRVQTLLPDHLPDTLADPLVDALLVRTGRLRVGRAERLHEVRHLVFHHVHTLLPDHLLQIRRMAPLNQNKPHTTTFFCSKYDF